MKRILARSESGEMGIGTLIVFVSMILVSAVAASVMIGTMGTLQQQAERTGEMATHAVSDGLEILAITGDRNTDSLSGTTQATIQVIEITARTRSGSSALSLSNMLIRISDGSRQADLSFDASGSSAANCTSTTYIVRSIKDDDSSISGDSVVDSNDVFSFIISTDSSATNLSLGPNTHFEISIIMPSGLAIKESIYTPQVYTTRYVTLL